MCHTEASLAIAESPESEIKTRQRRVNGRVSVNVYMTKDLARRLDVRAESENRSRSDMARELIESALASIRQGAN